MLVDGTPPFSLYGKERERFRERSDLQDAAAAAFRKREIRRLNCVSCFLPHYAEKIEGNGQGYIPTYPSDYLSDFSWDYREKIDLRSQMAAGVESAGASYRAASW